ncbi:MAG: hypothetical protein ACR2LI_00280 [Propionibacteriaceae bacterium]
MRRFRLVRLCGLAVLALALLVPALPAQAAVTKVGTYYAVKPARLLDTRTGLGAPAKQKLAPGKTLTLKVAGRGGVPNGGVSAVVFNVTATNVTATSGYVSIYPAGTSRPATSSINVAKGRTTANSATVKLGSAGSVTIYNSQGGSTDVIVDVSGFYNSSASPAASLGTGAGYQLLDPERLGDTRTDAAGPLAGRDTLITSVDFEAAGQNAAVRAVAVNLTATGATRNGYLTAWNGVGSRPNASTLNFEKTTSVANFAVVRTSLDTSGRVQFVVFNGSSDRVNVLVDLVGVYTTDAVGAGLRFTALNPTRITDSRTTRQPLRSGQTQEIQAPTAVANPATYAIVTNTVAIGPTASTYLTLWDAGTRPGVSTLNAPAGRTVANGSITPVDADYFYSIFNRAGTTNFAVDVTGRFEDKEIGTQSARQPARYDARHAAVLHARER